MEPPARRSPSKIRDPLEAGSRSPAQVLGKVLLFAIAYFVCAMVGDFITGSRSVFVTLWLPAGLYVAALLLNPRRDWAWLVLGALAAEMAFAQVQGVTAGAQAAFFGANALQAIFGAWVGRRAIDRDISPLSEFLLLMLSAVVLAPMVGACIGAGALVSNGLATSWSSGWASWWGSNAVGTFILFPLLLAWFTSPKAEIRQMWHRARAVEMAAVITGMLVLVWLVFRHSGGIYSPFKVSAIPFLLFAGLRFGRFGAACVAFVLSLAFAIFTVLYLDRLTPDQIASEAYILVLRSNLAVIPMLALLPAIVMAGHDAAMAQLGESEHRFRQLTDAAFDAIFISEKGVVSDANDRALELTGYERDELIGKFIPDIVAPESRDTVREAIMTRREVTYEHAMVRKNGDVVFVETRARMSADGVTRMTTVRDITARKNAESERARLLHELGERVKELSALHKASDLLQADNPFDLRTLEELVVLMPAAWQHPEICEARIVFAGMEAETSRWRRTPWLQTAEFSTGDGRSGEIAVAYLEPRPDADEGPFLTEERNLIQSLAKMLAAHIERKDAEKRIQQVNRTYAVLSEINKLIVRERQPQAFLDAACRIAVNMGGFRMVWIGMLNEQEAAVDPVASAGVDANCFDAMDRELCDPSRDYGPTAAALSTGAHQICNDLSEDRRAAPWREAAQKQGLCSLAVLPLRIKGRVKAVFELYAGEVNFFDEEEMRLLDGLAADIAFAMEVHERDAERIHAQDALRESDQRFRELAETVEDVFWISDLEKTKVLYVSPAYEKVWKRTCQSLYEWPAEWMQSIHPADRERVRQAALTKQITNDYDEEYRILTPDGETRWIRDRAFPVRDNFGRVARIVGVARDITERRQLQEQFRQSQKMEAIGQLAGGVAHDFNNLLGVMMLRAELAEMDDSLSAKTREGISEIRLAAERAANLTRQLLLFSRKQVMQARDLDLNQAVIQFSRMLQRIIGSDVRIQLHLDANPMIVHADPGMLDQVLLNLAVNARDAMPDGGQLTIATTIKDVDAAYARRVPGGFIGRHVCLSVSDTGTGIPAEVLPRIFEPFFTTKEAGKGTGLGLATVFGIVKQHHGWLDVDSALGKGTKFEVYLPASSATPESLDGNGRPKPQGGTETLLIAEDEPTIRLLTRAALERFGYQVLEAGDGIEALRVWREHRGQIALLLTDLVMPQGLNGQQLARQLRADKAELKVIYISGYGADILGPELELKENEKLLQKPCPVDVLLETVRHCLDA